MTPSLALLSVAGVLFFESFEPGWESRWSARELSRGSHAAELVRESGDAALRLESAGAAKAYFRELEGRGASVTNLSWRWRVAAPLDGAADERTRAGDDYAARLFVVFDPLPLGRSTRALCYVWAAREPVGSAYPSPYAGRVATFVVQSGAALAGQWLSESRDALGDYERAFGQRPEGVTAIAIMVDTDDTGGRATAWFDDIVLE